MKIETAINKIQKEYERTKNLEFVRNPMAYALSSRAIYHIIFSIIPDIKDFFIIAKFNSYFFHSAFSFSPCGR